MIKKSFPILKPNTPLPEPMTALDPESWAYETITRRWPEIAQRIFSENDLRTSIRKRIDNLIAEIPEAFIQPVKDPGAPDVQNWNLYLQEHAEKNWLEPPWFFTEHYFYRRIIQATRYFQFGKEKKFDPYSFQKKHGLERSRTAIKDLAERASRFAQSGFDQKTLVHLLYLDLWGNQADLSMWPAQDEAKPDHDDLELASEFLLEDRAFDVADYIKEIVQNSKFEQGLRVDFIIDNAGFELVSDLVLADYLLSSGITQLVRFHVKPHPTYVSDAVVKDVLQTIDFFKLFSDPLVVELGTRLGDYWAQERLQVCPNFFWTCPLPGWEMPINLKEELSQSDLVISKGDANYRRWLGDLDWPKTTPFTDILAYFPAPIVALRTCKAEIVCGLQPGQAEQTAAKDPNWMIDGRWGVVQFFRPG